LQAFQTIAHPLIVRRADSVWANAGEGGTGFDGIRDPLSPPRAAQLVFERLEFCHDESVSCVDEPSRQPLLRERQRSLASKDGRQEEADDGEGEAEEVGQRG
jgi:hypothetical protein